MISKVLVLRALVMCANNTGIKMYAEVSHGIPGLYIFVGGQVKEPLKIFYITDTKSEKNMQGTLHHHLERTRFMEVFRD